MQHIPLRGGLVTAVDDIDFEWLSAIRWHQHLAHTGSYYAAAQFPSVRARNGMGIRQMQRVILDPDRRLHRSVLVDHINGDTLDNRRENLRLVDYRTSTLNTRLRRNNKSGYRWVLKTKYGRWQVMVRTTKDGKRYHGAYFDDPHDAAEAANEIALRIFGPDARLNVIRRESR